MATLALAADTDALSQIGSLIPKDWQKRLPHNSSPYTSTIIFAVRLDSPEHGQVQDAKAFAYVRPHDLDVARYTPGASNVGIVAKLTRAIVVGPVARLELEPVESHFGKDAIIEAQLSASQ